MRQKRGDRLVQDPLAGQVLQCPDQIAFQIDVARRTVPFPGRARRAAHPCVARARGFRGLTYAERRRRGQSNAQIGIACDPFELGDGRLRSRTQRLEGNGRRPIRVSLDRSRSSSQRIATMRGFRGLNGFAVLMPQPSERPDLGRVRCARGPPWPTRHEARTFPDPRPRRIGSSRDRIAQCFPKGLEWRDRGSVRGCP